MEMYVTLVICVIIRQNGREISKDIKTLFMEMCDMRAAVHGPLFAVTSLLECY